jgi:hypothetical protein
MALSSRRNTSGSAGLSKVARISSAVGGEGAVNIRCCRSIRLRRWYAARSFTTPSLERSSGPVSAYRDEEAGVDVLVWRSVNAG